jgi:hypothetical protein
MRKGLFAARPPSPLAFAVHATAQFKVSIEQTLPIRSPRHRRRDSPSQPLVVQRIAYFDTAGKQSRAV